MRGLNVAKEITWLLGRQKDGTIYDALLVLERQETKYTLTSGYTCSEITGVLKDAVVLFS